MSEIPLHRIIFISADIAKCEECDLVLKQKDLRSVDRIGKQFCWGNKNEKNHTWHSVFTNKRTKLNG